MSEERISEYGELVLGIWHGIDSCTCAQRSALADLKLRSVVPFPALFVYILKTGAAVQKLSLCITQGVDKFVTYLLLQRFYRQ